MTVNRFLFLNVMNDKRILKEYVVTEGKVIEQNENNITHPLKSVSMSGDEYQNILVNLFTSEVFRKFILDAFYEKVIGSVSVILSAPPTFSLGAKWSSRLQILVKNKLQYETAMAYLSTLGGAFSALGDSFSDCARRAGIISLQQFQIALLLDEEPLTVRCRLYMALSMIQRGDLKSAKLLLLQMFQQANKLNDTRLKNMCKGVWSKLQYSFKLRSQSKKG